MSGLTLTAKMDHVFDQLQQNKAQVTEKFSLLLTELQSIRESQNFLSKKFDAIEKRLNHTEEELKITKKENIKLKEDIKHLKTSIASYSGQLNELEQYGRRDCLEIKGIPYNKEECTDEIVVSVAKKTGINITKNDISISHRLPSRQSNTQQPPTIIAKFLSRKTRDDLYMNRKKLHKINMDHQATKIYINESLTKINRKIFNTCLAFKRNEGYKFIWTKNGSTLLKKDEGTSAIWIKNEDDLKKFKIPNIERGTESN